MHPAEPVHLSNCRESLWVTDSHAFQGISELNFDLNSFGRWSSGRFFGVGMASGSALLFLRERFKAGDDVKQFFGDGGLAKLVIVCAKFD